MSNLQLDNEQIKAVNILIAAAGVAQKAGAFSLEDAKTIFQAIKTLAPEQEVEKKEEVSA